MKREHVTENLLPGSVRLGRVAGIPIGLHFSWFIIAALITMSLATHFRVTHDQWSGGLIWGTAILTAILFFGTLLAHELSHALVARARGLPTRSITLFALGGIAHIARDANSATTEFLVAIVGPITSFAIGVMCMGIARSIGWSFENGGGAAGAALGWLGSINVLLALFNLVPGYPLDGGRVLRAVLWWSYKDANRATRIAARVGQVVAGLLITIGLFQFFAGVGFGGLWLAFIGWFLLMAAQSSYTEAALPDALADVRVADVMANDCTTADADASVQSIVDDLLLRTGRRCVIVQSNSHIVGLVTPHEVRAVDRSRWPDVTAADVMRPLGTLQTVEPETPAADAFATMVREDVNQLPVIADGHLTGIVSRGHIMRLLQARAELRT